MGLSKHPRGVCFGIFVQAHYSEPKHAPDPVCLSSDGLSWMFKAGAWDLHGNESKGRDPRARGGLQHMACTGSVILVSENAKVLDLGSNPGPPSYMPSFLAICASWLVIYIIKQNKYNTN